jgi:hypothetical protein
MAAEGAVDLSAAAGELGSAAASALDANDRLAVIAEGQVLMARALAQQTQLLSQLVKIQAIAVLNEAAPPDSVLREPSDQAGAP